LGPAELRCPQTPSDTGAYRLSWTGPAGATFRLEESGAVLYEGPAKATTISGRRAGDHGYRLGVVQPAGEIAWSDSCVVQVRPPALSTAMFLFFVGLGVFLATLAVIVRGHIAHKRENQG
jgi:hypothetical protein